MKRADSHFKGEVHLVQGAQRRMHDSKPEAARVQDVRSLEDWLFESSYRRAARSRYLAELGAGQREPNRALDSNAMAVSRSYAERARRLVPAVSDSLRTVPGLRTCLHRACQPWALFHLVVYHIYR